MFHLGYKKGKVRYLILVFQCNKRNIIPIKYKQEKLSQVFKLPKYQSYFFSAKLYTNVNYDDSVKTVYYNYPFKDCKTNRSACNPYLKIILQFVAVMFPIMDMANKIIRNSDDKFHKFFISKVSAQ